MYSPFSYFIITTDVNGFIKEYSCIDDSDPFTEKPEKIKDSYIYDLFGNDIEEDYNRALNGETVYFETGLSNKFKKELSLFITPHRNGVRIIAFKNKNSKRMLTELAGGIAHSFNNGLNEIVGNAELLMLFKPDDQDVSNYTEKIISSVRRMSNLMNKVLEYTRGVLNEKISLMLDSRLESVISEIIIPPGIILSSDLNYNDQILFETGKLKTVINSLISNSVDSIEDTGRINVSTCRTKRNRKDYALITVEDDGCGMEKDVMEKMFNPFYSTKRSGRGLDLASVHGIVENHDGFIEVDSGVGIGTTVNVFIPTVEVKRREMKNEKKETGKGNILVVEDEDTVMETTTILLENSGYTVFCAETGEMALDILENNNKIDVVLLDINLPGISGFDVLDRVFHRVNSKFIICSAWCDRESVKEYREKGISFIAKPYSFDTLLKTIRKYLDRRKHERFILKDDTFVTLNEDSEGRAKIVDISLGGICFITSGMIFSHIDNISINIGDKSDFISSIPLILINDMDNKEIVRGQFGELNSLQKEAISNFIQNNTTL